MAMPIDFDKCRAEYILECLDTGKPVAPRELGWNRYTMLEVAGACFFGLLSQGPVSLGGEFVEPDDWHPEHKEASNAQLFRDIHAAIEFYGNLMMAVKDDQYDERNEPICKALVSDDGEKKLLHPIEGFKNMAE